MERMTDENRFYLLGKLLSSGKLTASEEAKVMAEMGKIVGVELRK